MGGEPGTEAHGGYTFCGFAAALLSGGCKNEGAMEVPREGKGSHESLLAFRT